MQRERILRIFFFIFFFSIGAAVLSGVMLCDDLLRHYRNRGLLKSAEENLGQLKSLNADYDILLKQLQEEPNVVERIAPAALGTEPTDADTIYPKATAERLAAARVALTEDLKQEGFESAIPDWLSRCSEFPQRVILFLAGAFLVLISFVFFGPSKQAVQKE